MTKPRTPDGPVGSDDTVDNHLCKPDAKTYYCPTAASAESDCHGGFDVCCAHPDLHQQLLACSLAVLRRSHDPHPWEPQPGMQSVCCEGYAPAEPAT